MSLPSLSHPFRACIHDHYIATHTTCLYLSIPLHTHGIAHPMLSHMPVYHTLRPIIHDNITYMHLLQPEHCRASQSIVQSTMPCTVRHRMASCGIAGHHRVSCRVQCHVLCGIAWHRVASGHRVASHVAL